MPDTSHHRARGRTVGTPALRLPPAAARLLALLALLTGGWLLTGTAAYAEEPFPLPDELVDHAGVLRDEAAVRDAQDRLFDETGLQLFVVYVDDFGGLSGPDWAAETAEVSHLGDRDLLVAVAVQERSWGDSIADGSGLSGSQLDAVASDFIEPALRNSDWDGAAIAAAEGYLKEATAPSTFWFGTAVVGGLAAAGYGVHRTRGWARRRKERAEERETLEETAQRVGGQLVRLDTALTAAEGELQYAEAEFSPELTSPFRAALATSREEAIEAYRLQERIAGADAEENHAGVVELYAELEELVTRAGDRLDEHASAFNELRALADRAPQRIEELSAAFATASTRVEDGLAVASARTDLPAGQHARLERLTQECSTLAARGEQALARAGERVTAGAPEEAVPPLKAAEEALSGLTARADRLSDLDALLDRWRGLLRDAADSLARDIADADRLAPQDPEVTRAAQAARTALGRVTDPAEDPVELTEELGDLEHGLDLALASHRQAEERHLKAVRSATDQLARSRARVEAMERELSRNRAYASSTALSRSTEARALLSQGEALLQTEPVQADSLLRDAAQRASSALNSIQNIREDAEASTSGGWGSSWSGSSGRSHRRSRTRSRTSSRSRSRSRSSRSSSRSSRSSRGGRF
ncbi:TPM domain-containing protein [Ornithinimicrobium cavernae]|uniref:TPM domain-containing protein n=1 Tax=Ornithinimicrobium cavernae TaxID=2666047 RepID=UPI000D6870D3|nr:TPM domain-containing protein [Ornithinimicrobium cavernae]